MQNSPEAQNNPQPRKERFTSLPVEISPERSQEIGNYFNELLEQHGEATDIPVLGRRKVNMWPGRLAKFTDKDRRLTIQKIDYETPEGGDAPFPETIATMFERTGKGKDDWERGDIFIFNLDGAGFLDYRRGNTLLYVKSDKKLKPGIEGVQSTGRRGMITANVTPPNSEGIITTLENFLDSTAMLVEKSQKPYARFKALGKRALKSAKRK